MDDFVISNLHESRNEWCSRLVSVLSPMVMEGIKSIYNEAWNMCVSSNEKSKYFFKKLASVRFMNTSFDFLILCPPLWPSIANGGVWGDGMGGRHGGTVWGGMGGEGYGEGGYRGMGFD